MRVADKVVHTQGPTIHEHRIVPPLRIGPLSGALEPPLDHSQLVSLQVSVAIIGQIDNTAEKLNLAEDLQLIQGVGLEVEFELQAVSAVELLPLLGLVGFK